jgi:hypothetical protein
MSVQYPDPTFETGKPTSSLESDYDLRLQQILIELLDTSNWGNSQLVAKIITQQISHIALLGYKLQGEILDIPPWI